jgi:cation diffusion facilitator CzcD-associated flavoprotein CzcO
MRAFRDGIYWVLEIRAAGFALHPRLMAPLQWMAEHHIARQISDRRCARGDAGLHDRLQADPAVLDYYPALTRPNVDLVTDPIARITQTGLACADDSAYDADVIIYGTGFKTVEAIADSAWPDATASSSRTCGAGCRAYHASPSPGSQISSCC